jgi:hypothetical protein
MRHHRVVLDYVKLDQISQRGWRVPRSTYTTTAAGINVATAYDDRQYSNSKGLSTLAAVRVTSLTFQVRQVVVHLDANLPITWHLTIRVCGAVYSLKRNELLAPRIQTRFVNKQSL